MLQVYFDLESVPILEHILRFGYFDVELTSCNKY